MAFNAVMNMRIQAVRMYLKRHADRAVPAIELAAALQTGGNRERKRRTVRQVVEAMHFDGLRVCADCHPTLGGYWLARSDHEWAEYQAARARRARFQFVGLAKMHKAAAEISSGQGRLW